MADSGAALDPNCKTCTFRRQGQEKDGDETGECRRHAPTARTFPVREQRSSLQENYAQWPVVFDDDWCGEWQRNPNL